MPVSQDKPFCLPEAAEGRVRSNRTLAKTVTSSARKVPLRVLVVENVIGLENVIDVCHELPSFFPRSKPRKARSCANFASS